MKRLMVVCLIIFVIIPVSVMSQPQQKPPRPVIEFDPVENPDIDMYLAHWRTNRPYVTHGELLNWDKFTRGKQLRKLPPGTAYEIPPNGMTPHSNINVSDEPIKLFWFMKVRD